MAFLNAVRWVKHVRGTQQINDSHPHALAYEIDSHELENASHFAMRISLFSSLRRAPQNIVRFTIYFLDIVNPAVWRSVISSNDDGRRRVDGRLRLGGSGSRVQAPATGGDGCRGGQDAQLHRGTCRRPPPADFTQLLDVTSIQHRPPCRVTS